MRQLSKKLVAGYSNRLLPPYDISHVCEIPFFNNGHIVVQQPRTFPFAL
jgi:hypothetical protein